MRPLLEWRDLDIDAQTIAIGIRLGGQRRDARLLRRHALQVIFGKEYVHNSFSRRSSACLFVEEERGLRVQPYTFLLDAFFDPLLEIFFFIFDGLSTG